MEPAHPRPTYREARTKDRYVEILSPSLAPGKPVILTEFGMRTYRGAESSGALDFGVTDTTRLWLHTPPVIGRFIRPCLKGTFERDEATLLRAYRDPGPARELRGGRRSALDLPDPRGFQRRRARHDLDMDSMSLVRPLRGGRRGAVYPDMPWEPKASFAAVAHHFLSH